MNRAFLVALVVGVAILALVTHVAALAPTQYRALTSGFATLVPAAPVDAGPTGALSGLPGHTAGRPPMASNAPSILPSGPTTAPGRTSAPKPSTRPACCIGPVYGAIKGSATWWDSFGHGFYAAAGPRLRAAIGPNWDHRVVTACSAGRCVNVQIITSCACSPDTRLIDLSLDAFSRLGDPGLGVLRVSVQW